MSRRKRDDETTLLHCVFNHQNGLLRVNLYTTSANIFAHWCEPCWFEYITRDTQ
eukprot:COSAG02_NODE_4336_length_5489_cov_5.862894_4_plen_53_part_01